MKIAYVFIGFILAAWLYSVIVTEPPYGLDKTPKTIDEITTKNMRQYR